MIVGRIMFQNIVNYFKIFMVDAEEAVDPLYDAVTELGPYAIGVVALLGMIYAVILGVRFSKAESNQEIDMARKQLISAIIGVVSIVILLSILYTIREPLIAWANGK